MEPELRTVTWTEAIIALSLLLAWPHCPTCMQDKAAVYMAVPRQEGLVTEAGACAQVRAALQTIPVPAPTTPTLEVSGRLPPQGLHGHLRVCPLQDQPPAIQVSAVAEGAEGFLEGTRETFCELWVPRSPSSPGTLGVWQGTGVLLAQLPN